MDSMGRKNNLQNHSQPEDHQECSAQGDFKRRRTKGHGEEIAEFFALVDRLRATNKILKQKCMACHSAEPRIYADMEGKIVRRKSPWTPSFEWEDFAYTGMVFTGDGGYAKARDFAKSKTSVYEEIQKDDIRSRQGINLCSSDKCCYVQSIDLNMEAPEE